MSLISGIPPWVQMYFEKLIEKSGKNVGDLFKNFNLFIFGGVNYEPYRAKFENLIGRKVDSIELYPASEGFFAFQDKFNDEQLFNVVGYNFRMTEIHAAIAYIQSKKHPIINDIRQR